MIRKKNKVFLKKLLDSSLSVGCSIFTSNESGDLPLFFAFKNELNEEFFILAEKYISCYLDFDKLAVQYKDSCSNMFLKHELCKLSNMLINFIDSNKSPDVKDLLKKLLLAKQ